MGVAIVSAGVTISQGVFQVLDFIKGVTSSDLISAYFAYNGSRLEGSDKIEVERVQSKDNSRTWWFYVKPVEGYVFVRHPVIQSCVQEIVGQKVGEDNPDAEFWRYVALERQGVIVDGVATPINVKVNFVVVGYKPKALLQHFS